MEERRKRIIEDLTPVLQGEIRCDRLTQAMYATDGSLYEIAPLGVVTPRNRDDVVALVRYAAQEKIPLIPRGAGTGIAGECLGDGIIVDFSRHMRAIESIGNNTVQVQPGVVCRALNEALRPHGRYFPPDPSGAGVTTIGSMLSLDAAGSHSLRIGSTRDHVESLEMVLANGEVFTFADEVIPHAGTGAGTTEGEPAQRRQHRELVEQLAHLLRENDDLIRRWHPSIPRNRCGYFLRGVMQDDCLRMPRLLVGAEGTLGLITSATLYTAPLPAHRGVVLLLFGNLEAATRAVQVIAQYEPSACDLLDRRLLTLAREADVRFHELISPQAEAALIVEQTGFSTAQIRSRIRLVINSATRLHDAAIVAHEAYTHAEVDFLWSLPERVVPLLARMHGPSRPLPFVEDIAVPPEVLHDFLVKAQNVFQKHRVTASLYAHAAAGQVHLRPFLPPPTADTAPLLEHISRDLYALVFQCGGTISGEHGTGLSRSAFVREQYGPLYDVFARIKELFDPLGLMNPGKVLTDDEHLTIRNLRNVTPASPETVPLQLRWQPDELWQSASRCNGCGHCRTTADMHRMCPVFHVQPTEEASPRAKANLMRQLMQGQLTVTELASPEFKRIANLCFNCKQCELECPSNVNIPHMMIEAKAAYVAEHGLEAADWFLSRAHAIQTVASLAAVAFNWLLASPASRWILEKLTGISRYRKLPRFSRRSFLRSVKRDLLARPLASSEKPVVYFVDHFANYHDPELGRAFVAILKHNRIPVYIPPHQLASGMAMISAGDLETARELARENLRALADFAREGSSIVCTEPAAAVCLRQEYPKLLDHPDVEVVASRVVEAGDFLMQLHAAGRLKTDFRPLEMTVGYHTPCHLKALGSGTPLAELLNLIPHLDVRRIEEGCSGMAGAWGLTSRNFRESIRIGWNLISRMRAGDLVAGVTECSSCKMQMEQGTLLPTIHPLKLLALSYGLMPEIQNRLQPSRKKLVGS
ncbi:MAG: anaerobic glycerol-3-phosphate dehydrogenase subunit C [Planctomycetes bacterium]|nr:anaerobic glycerol-3-phosphate dehydrogenase subunit C [Planctomycetota bacterium]